MGSPKRKLVRRPPAKIVSIDDSQFAKGCLRENGREPVQEKAG